MNTKKHMIKKIFTDFVLFNIFINGLFYVITFKDYEGILYLDSIKQDLLFGLFILGVFCTYMGFIGTWKDVIKGSYFECKTNKLYQVLPKNNALRVLLGVVFACGVIYPLCILIPKSLGVNEINHLFGFMMKVGSAIVASAVVGYVVIQLSIGDHQSLSRTTELKLEKGYTI